jgi:cyclophilin family peptidyl-prolyl cis-trans isomerase
VTVNTDGTYSFTTTFATDGTDDGLHTISFVARDQAGNVSAPVEFTLTLDSAVAGLSLDLDESADTAGGGVAGNNRTILETVTLRGVTEPGATVELVGTAFSTTADAQGAFSFANIQLDPGANTFTARATDSNNNTQEVTLVVVRDSDPTVASPVQNFAVTESAPATILNLPAIFSDVDVNSLVRFTTPAGIFELELFDQQTPLTVQNFLQYVSSGRYDNTIFHRLVPDSFILSGGFELVAGTPSSLNPIVVNPAVPTELGISNLLGTIGMFRPAGQPNGATSQFYFNLTNNANGPLINDTNDGGFAAFGQLRGNGLSIIQGFAELTPQNRGGSFDQIPLQNYPAPPGGNFPGDTTAANYALINGITIVRQRDADNGDALAFTIPANTNPDLVQASISGGKLTLTYAAGESGRATLKLRATDSEGRFVETMFTVTVGDVPEDTTPPVVELLSPLPGQTLDDNVTIEGKVTDVGSGVLFLTASVDGGPAMTIEFTPETSFEFLTTFATDGSDDGEHTITFVARDIAGNVSAPETFTFTLQTPLRPFATNNAADSGDGTERSILESVDPGSLTSAENSLIRRRR